MAGANAGIIGPTQTVSFAEKSTSFTSTGCFNRGSPKSSSVNVLVIGAGSGGGGNQGGGGGAGGYRFNATYSITCANYKVTIGAGGTGAVGTGPYSNGSASSFNSCCAGCGAKFESAAGGRGGGATPSPNGGGGTGASGGSGGGGGE